MGEQLKQPPYSVEAEQSVLGALMHHSEKWDDVSEIITADDFYRRDHKLIFEAISRLANDGTPCDAVTLSESLDRAGELDNVGGLSYVGSLQANVVAQNAKAYAQIVKQKSVERQLLSASLSIGGLAYAKKPFAEKIDEAQALVQAITEDTQSAGPVHVKNILTRCINQLDARFESKGKLTGLATGLKDLDKKLLGLQPSDLIILAGRPSMGKTALALNIAEKVSIRDAQPTLFVSLEMGDIQLVDRVICSLGGVDSYHYRSGKIQDDEWPKITSAVSRITDAPLFIDETPALNINQVRARARKIKREHGLSLLVVDYLQLMSGQGENRTQVISEISRGLKSIAKELNIPVLVLCQLNRSLEQRVNKRPFLADLRESGGIEQDADVVVFIYRDEVYQEDSPEAGIAELIIGKHRNGATGTVRAHFDGSLYRFSDLTEEYTPKTNIKPLREIYK